jgi:hypothetical protein
MPELDETKKERLLNYAVENFDTEKGQAVGIKLGVINPQEARMLSFAAQNPQDPRSAQVLSKVKDNVAGRLPALQEQGVSVQDRALLKNVIGKEPALQEKALQERGFQTRFVDEQLQVKMPGDIRFKVVDPKGFDVQDISDVGVDIAEGVVTGLATGAKALGLVGAPVTGGASLAATSALGGASTAGFEGLRQGVGKLLGLREEIDAGEIATAGAIGASVPFLFKGGSEVLKKFGKGLVSLFPESKAAPAIKEAAETLGVTPTKGQISGQKGVKKAEALLAKDDFNVGGFFLRRQRAANKEALQEVADSITTGASARDMAQIGQSVKAKLQNAVSKRLEPAEVIYDKYETIFKRKAFTPDLEPLKKQVTELKEAFKLSRPSKRALKDFSKELDQVNNLTDLKRLRSQIGKAMRSDFQLRPALSPLYGGLTDARSATLKKLAQERGGDFFDLALAEITHADQIYRSTADDVARTLGVSTKEGVEAAVERYASKVDDGNVVSNLFNFKDPKKVQKLAESFPDAFKDLQEGALNELVRKSTDPATDIVSPLRLANQIEKLEHVSSEALNVLLGKDAGKKAAALRAFIKSIPDTRQFNSSDTAQFMRAAFSIAGFQQPFALWRSTVLNSPGILRAVGRGAEKTGRVFELPLTRGIGIAAGTDMFQGQPQQPGFALPKGSE